MSVSKNCFLRGAGAYLEEATEHRSKAAACISFQRTARELGQFGQHYEAGIHYADTREAVREYPDFVLSLGPRGGLKIERA